MSGASPPPAARSNRVQTVCLVILTAIAVGAALKWLSPVMIPFVLAIFIAQGLSPVMSFQEKQLRFPRPAALLTTIVLGLGMLTLLASLVSASVSQLSANADAYAAQLSRFIAAVVDLLPDEIFGFRPADELAAFTSLPVQTIGRMIGRTTNAILGVLSQSLLVFIFVCFMLIGRSTQQATGVWGEAERSVKRFLVTKAVISAATGFLVGTTLTLLGIDLALVFGLMAFLLNFIPSIGSIIATLLPLPVVVVAPEVSVTTAVLAILVPGAIQVTIGNFLEPRIMGSSLDLHPVVILLALIFWGILWGIVGMLLATPITAVMRIVFDKIEMTRTIADVMAGRLDALRSPEATAAD